MRRNWIKLYVDQCLRGTMMKELPYNERWLWFGVLLLAGDSPFEGKICITENIGYTDEQIAEILETPVSVYKSAKEKMLKHDKISVDKNGVIKIVNWKRYQSEYRRQKPYRESNNEKLQSEVTNSSLSISTSNSSSSSLNNTYLPGFEFFWTPYPRKIEKKDAFTAWKQLTNKQKEEVFIASKNYAIEMKREGRALSKIKHPASFLNKDKERWKDYLEITKPYQVGENIHKSKPSEDAYYKERVFKSIEIDKELASEVKKARKAKDTDRLDELENIKKEKIAEWSQKRQKNTQAI